jgi:hypothetical protein
MLIILEGTNIITTPMYNGNIIANKFIATLP